MAQTKEHIVADIEAGRTTLGIEYGSTRIKAVLDDATNEPVAIGTFDWENSLVDGYWTYSEQEIFDGLKACYASLKADVAAATGCDEADIDVEIGEFDDFDNIVDATEDDGKNE